MKLEQVRDYCIIIWLILQSLLSVWGWSQQTLIARSQQTQQIEQLQQQLQKMKEEKK